MQAAGRAIVTAAHSRSGGLLKRSQTGRDADREQAYRGLNEYGLTLDFVPAHTYEDQAEGYLRYQLSTGGPGDEFRYYLTAELGIYRIVYVFLDWGDGAKIILRPDSKAHTIMTALYQDWAECGVIRDLIGKREE